MRVLGPSVLCGRLLAVLSVAPAAALACALAAVWPLLALNVLSTWAALLLGVPAAAVGAYASARLAVRAAAPVPVWTLLGVIAVGAAAAVFAGAHHSEHVVLRRDAGAYALTARWIANEGSRTIPVHWDELGGRDPALRADSPAYFAEGDHLVPQFLSGMPLLLAGASRMGGLEALLRVPSVIGGLALICFGGLTARLVRPGAGPVAAGLLGLTYPVQLVMRSTYSETLALLLLLAGLALLVDAVHECSAWGAFVAGFVVSLGTLVRVDALREVAFLFPVAAFLFAQRRREGVMLAIGLLMGTIWGAADALLLALPYTREVKSSILPLTAAAAGLAVVSLVLALLWRRRPAGTSPLRMPRAAPWVGGGLVTAAGLALALRPLFWLGRQDPDSDGGRAVLGFQRVTRLPLDASRTYTEHSVTWVSWWTGWPMLVLALLGASVLTYRVVARRDGEAAWAQLLLLLLASSMLVLLRPGITPDHPWADRRLVVVVLPAVVLFACAGGSALVQAAQERVPSPLASAVLVLGSLALLWFPWHAAHPLMKDRTEVGEVSALHRACASLHPGDVALLVDNRSRREWAQVLRGECDVPTAGVEDRTQLPDIIARIKARGGHPVLVAADHPRRVAFRGAPSSRVVHLDTFEDSRLLVTPPTGTNPLDINLWFGRP